MVRRISRELATGCGNGFEGPRQSRLGKSHGARSDHYEAPCAYSNRRRCRLPLCRGMFDQRWRSKLGEARCVIGIEVGQNLLSNEIAL